MKLYVNLGPIDEHDAIDELKKEQNMKPNMPDRGKALEAAPEKDFECCDKSLQVPKVIGSMSVEETKCMPLGQVVSDEAGRSLTTMTVTEVSVDPVTSARAEDIVEAPMSEPVPQVTQAQEPTTALAEETAAEPVLDTVDTVQDVPAAEEAKDEEKPVKKSKAKKSKAK